MGPQATVDRAEVPEEIAERGAADGEVAGGPCNGERPELVNQIVFENNGLHGRRVGE